MKSETDMVLKGVLSISAENFQQILGFDKIAKLAAHVWFVDSCN